MIRIATSRDVSRLAGAAGDPEESLASGAVRRVKVQGQWLYLEGGRSLQEALDAAELALAGSLAEWLLSPGRFLVGMAMREARALELGRPAFTLLLHELCARGRLHGLPQLTRERQPYLAFHLPADDDEIARQLACLAQCAAERGRVNWRDLPEPERAVGRKAWRMHVVDHGEWLGLGWLEESGSLVAW